jgi:hypothetical protein
VGTTCLRPEGSDYPCSLWGERTVSRLKAWFCSSPALSEPDALPPLYYNPRLPQWGHTDFEVAALVFVLAELCNSSCTLLGREW